MPDSIRPNTFAVPQRRPHIEDDFGGNPKASGLPCPVLSTLVNEGRLVPDENGEVSLDAMRSALASLGVDEPLQNMLATDGAKATESLERNVLNLLRLEGSPIEHKASLGPLQDGGFNPYFLDQLKSFSSDGESVTFDDLAAASQLRILQDNAIASASGGEQVTDKEMFIGQFELSALFTVFGKPNAAGEKALSLEDLDLLFRENKLPPGFEAASSVNQAAVMGTAMKLAAKQNMGSAAARAEAGLREAQCEPQSIDTTSMLGLGAMCPAGMRPRDGAGVSPTDIGSLHADVPAEQSE